MKEVSDIIIAIYSKSLVTTVWLYVECTYKFASLTAFQLAFFDGAVMVTVGASICTSVYIAYIKGAGFAMFIGATVLLLVKVTL